VTWKNSVEIVKYHGLGGQGAILDREKTFLHSLQTGSEYIRCPIKCTMEAVARQQCGSGLKLATHFLPVSRSRSVELTSISHAPSWHGALLMKNNEVQDYDKK
jgi:hypothetical protein